MKARMRYRNNCAATTISALLSKFLAIVTMRNDKTVARRGRRGGGGGGGVADACSDSERPVSCPYYIDLFPCSTRVLRV